MKQLSWGILLALCMAVVSCDKVQEIQEIPFIDCSNGAKCEYDTLITKSTDSNYSGNATAQIADSCHKLDGVNVDELTITESTVLLGFPITIKLKAIGISQTCSGTIMFASKKLGNKIEVKTFMGYNVCEKSSNQLWPINGEYYFIPNQLGEYHFRFKNIYGTSHEIKVNVI
jgi:hypothetical protein